MSITDAEFAARRTSIKSILVSHGYPAAVASKLVDGSGGVLYAMQPFLTAVEQASYVATLYPPDQYATEKVAR